MIYKIIYFIRWFFYVQNNFFFGFWYGVIFGAVVLFIDLKTKGYIV